MQMIPAGNTQLLEDLRREWIDVGDSPMKYVGLLRSGVTWKSFRALAKALGLSEAAAAEVLRIPPRTLARRKGGRLDLHEGERVLRLIRLVARAVDVLGSPQKAARWLDSSNGALEGATPISLIDTDIGTQAADAVLGRIEYGVYS